MGKAKKPSKSSSRKKMTLTTIMEDLVKMGCFPCCSYRGNSIYRAYINGAGNQWDEGKTPDSAMIKAFKAWKKNGKPFT
jgi:hypothetical protein